MTPAEQAAAPLSITDCLVMAAAAAGAVGKDSTNREQGFNFRGIDAVVNAVSGPLRDQGIVVVPEVRDVTRTSAPTRSGGTINVVRVIVAYHFGGPAGDWLTAVVPGEAFDSGDKATAKAMSVAFRTALLQTLTLPTDERDPDADVYTATPPKDWDAVLATALGLSDEGQLRKLWADEGVAYAPPEIAAQVTEHINAVRAQAAGGA